MESNFEQPEILDSPEISKPQSNLKKIFITPMESTKYGRIFLFVLATLFIGAYLIDYGISYYCEINVDKKISILSSGHMQFNRLALSQVRKEEIKKCQANVFTYITNGVVEENAEKVQQKPQEQVSSAPNEKIPLKETAHSEQKDFSAYVNNLISMETAPTWKSYNKKFGEYVYSFSYPSNGEIYDVDDQSGAITIFLSKSKTERINISVAPHTYFQNDYNGDFVIKWYTESGALYSSDPLSYEDTVYEEYKFQNGKVFYRILEWANGKEPKYDYFLGVVNDIPIYLEDASELPVEDVLTILQSLSIR